MRRISVKVLLMASLVASTLPAPRAAAERDIVVSVLDATNAPVADLAPRDLVVREDGVAREVLRVRKARTPLSIALLVDDSAASRDAMADIRNGVTAFFDTLDPRHEVALVTFGDRATVVVDYARDRERLKRGASRLFARDGAGATFLDAVSDVSRGIEKRSAERPVIVAVMTEGTEFSTLSYQLVLQRLYASGAQLHALVLTSEAEANPLAEETRNRNIVLDEGTRGTGGRRDQLLASMALPGALKELAAELENQWIVTYSRPDSLIPPERVQVEAKREGLVVRARTRLSQAKVSK
ncbi:MAG TPA: VWA domain-containing protein [Vicinamibacterales bacterium]|nr:VWA domain-containing protein [Vicinamibacterales bacterium]